MISLRSSLGGKNSHRRVNGARSSRASSAIFNKLRNLDRQITDLDKKLHVIRQLGYVHYMGVTTKSLEAKRQKLDEKRRIVRHIRIANWRGTNESHP